MRIHFKLGVAAMLGLLSAGSALAAQHEMKGMGFNGSFEGGYTNSWVPSGAKESQFTVDNATLKMTADVSDKVSLVFENAFSVNTGNAALWNARGGATFFSGARLTPALAGASNFTFANNGAYIEHKTADGVTLNLGHVKTPFAMESLWSRYNMHGYFYSAGYTAFNMVGAAYDVGLVVKLADVLPGNADFALLDGRNYGGDNFTPAGGLRWWYEMKSGDLTITPVLSTFMGRWKGSPSDLAISAGTMIKSGMWWFNLEWVYARTYTTAGDSSTKLQNMSIWGEPGFSIEDIADISLKVDHSRVRAGTATTDTTDWNVSGVVSHSYSDKSRVRAMYQHANLSGNAGAHTNLIGLFWGTQW